MDKFVIKNQKKDASNSKTIKTNENRIELDMNDIVADLGLRKLIDEFPHEIRDDAKRHIYKWVHVNHLVIHFHEHRVILKLEALFNLGSNSLIG
jgi:hypothetical protein